METTMEYAQYILECSKQDPASLLRSSASSIKGKSLDDKLLALYLEQSAKREEGQNLDTASNLLSKLLKRERLNCLVLSLYPGNEGYSLMLRSRSGVELETIKLPYEESEILDYIDAAELPPFLLDLLEKSQVNVFYSGCVIVEVRDYRRSTPGVYDTSHVLLRPSAQSMLCDVAALTAEYGNSTWTQDDVNQLESELLMQTAEPLCLDPSPAVAIVATELTRQQKRFNEPSLKRAMKRHSQIALNRKRKMAQAPAPRELRLLDFLHKRRDKSKTPSKALKNVDTWKQKPVHLTVPRDFDTHSPERFFKVMERPSSPNDNLIVVEEQRLERDPNQEHRMLAVITVFRQRLADGYVGRLYLDHDYSGDDTNLQGCSCQFPLGIRQNVDRYLDQFRDLFTEEGRRLVKITTSKPGQPEHVLFTAIPPSIPPTPTSVTPATSITISSAQALLKQATAIPVSMTQLQGDGSVSSLAAKRNIPIQLSLSITPGSGTPTLLPAQGTNQATVTLSQTGQSQASSQRLKQLSIHQRSTPSPMPSPASTPTSTAQQIAAIVSQQASLQKVPPSIPTPPPNVRTPTPTSHTPSITPTSIASRRSSGTVTLEGLSGGQGSQQSVQPTHNISFVTQAVGSGTVNQGSNQSTQLSNINIASLSSLPPGINLQGLTGLSGVSLANLGLQTMQVSLSMPGGIAVPVPITMITTNPSLLQNQAAIMTSSSGSSQAALVTMVTALPATTANTSSGSSTTGTMSSQQVVMSTGTNHTVLPTNSGMLSLPVGLSSLTQLMPVTTKTQGMRTQTSLPLLQVGRMLPGGQQSIQLLSLQQQQGRGQLKTGTLTAAITSAPQQGNINRQGSTTAVPLSSVLTSQQMSALTSLTVGKAGSGSAGTIQAGQYIQLTGTSGQGATGVTVGGPQGSNSALHTQLAFQKAPGQGQTLQLHQLQFKQAHTLNPTAIAAASKSKSKKRGGTTPPKS